MEGALTQDGAGQRVRPQLWETHALLTLNPSHVYCVSVSVS
jgi:hypothetical protein